MLEVVFDSHLSHLNVMVVKRTQYSVPFFSTEKTMFLRSKPGFYFAHFLANYRRDGCQIITRVVILIMETTHVIYPKVASFCILVLFFVHCHFVRLFMFWSYIPVILHHVLSGFFWFSCLIHTSFYECLYIASFYFCITVFSFFFFLSLPFLPMASLLLQLCAIFSDFLLWFSSRKVTLSRSWYWYYGAFICLLGIYLVWPTPVGYL